MLTAAAANHGSDQARVMAVEQLMRDVVDLYNQHTTSLKRRQSPAISGAVAWLAQLHASYPDPEQWSARIQDQALEHEREIQDLIEEEAAEVARREAVLITNDAAADYDIASRVAVENKTFRFVQQQLVPTDPNAQQSLDRINDPEIRRRLEQGPGWDDPPPPPTYKVVPHDGNGRVTAPQALIDNALNFHIKLYAKGRLHRTALDMVVHALPAENCLEPDMVQNLAPPRVRLPDDCVREPDVA